MEAILHDGNELLVAKLTVAVIVEYFENSVHNMGAEIVTRADPHCAMELVWE